MTINGVSPLGQPLVIGRVEDLPALPAPAGPMPCEQPISWEVPPGPRGACRAGLSSLRYQALQIAPVDRVNTTPPGQHSTDSQLAGELYKDFGELHPFLKDGCLTQSSLRRIAAQPLTGG